MINILIITNYVSVSAGALSKKRMNEHEKAMAVVIKRVQSYPGYPYLGYPKPRLSERSSERGVCLKKWYFSLKSQSLRLSRVHMFVCHMYMFNVGTQ